MVRTNIPIVYIADRTIRGAYNYHEQFKNLFSFSREQSFFIDSEILRKASLICFPSKWAYDSAIREYNVPAEKLRMIPFGANLDEVPAFNPGRTEIPEIRLLFIGISWKNKGGIIAYETLVSLREKGYKAKLVICGCNPPAAIANDVDVIDEGFLRKDNEDEYALLLKHFNTADFLILPTRYEAYGLVFCEAAAHSLPVLATDTGGIPTIVEHGKTGFLFSPEDRGEKYAEKIIAVVKNKELLSSMRKSSYDRFLHLLNWNAWLQSFLAALHERNLIKNS
jgi:glycosyltransferase involved in cell wall biosynthesis